jgi:hypothetical protein
LAEFPRIGKLGFRVYGWDRSLFARVDRSMPTP